MTPNYFSSSTRFFISVKQPLLADLEQIRYLRQFLAASDAYIDLLRKDPTAYRDQILHEETIHKAAAHELHKLKQRLLVA